MKKKILFLIIAVLLLIPCFVLSVSADTYCDISLGHNYQYLVHNGDRYTRFDSSMTECDYARSFNGVTYDIDEVKYVDYDLSVNDVIITATIYLNDGSSISASYINENYSSEHAVLSKYAYEYTVDFYYPDDNQVKIASKNIFAEKTTLEGIADGIYDSFDVNAYCADGSFYIKKGTLYTAHGKYYYIDFYELGVKDPYSFSPESQDSIEAYKITDAEVVAELDEACSGYNDDLIGLLDSDITDNIAAVILTIAFAVIPLAAFIAFLILAIRAKTPSYKKLFRAIWITAAAELVVFAVTVVLIMNF